MCGMMPSSAVARWCPMKSRGLGLLQMAFCMWTTTSAVLPINVQSSVISLLPVRAPRGLPHFLADDYTGASAQRRGRLASGPRAPARAGAAGIGAPNGVWLQRRGLGPPYSGILSATRGAGPSSDPGDRMRLRRWQVEIAVTLIVAAIVVYALRWFLFPSANFHREMLRYLVDDIAFLFIQVLLVSMLLDGLMQRPQPRDHAEQAQHDHRRVLQRVRHRRAGTHREARHRSGRGARRPAGADGVEARDYELAKQAFREHTAGHRAEHRRPRRSCACASTGRRRTCSACSATRR